MNTQGNQTPVDAVLAAIRRIQERKRDARKHPDHVMIAGDRLRYEAGRDISAEVFQRTLRTLEYTGKIHKGPTMHDAYVRETETANQ